jgi:hypothetical protein
MAANFVLVKWDRTQGNRRFWGGFQWKSMSQGVATHVFAAFHQSITYSSESWHSTAVGIFLTYRVLEDNGGYLEDSHVLNSEDIRCWGRDPVEAERLWKLTEEIVGEKFDY